MGSTLLNALSQEDKDKITRYVSYYGGANGEFIGVDAWLEEWAKANKKLYKLLGNQLMVKIPYSYKKNEDIIKDELANLFQSDLGVSLEGEFYQGVLALQHLSIISPKQGSILRSMFYPRIYCSDKIDFDLNIKYENKSLRLSSGMKLIRALGKTIEWFRKVKNEQTFCSSFETFRVAHSRIYNGEVTTSNFVISIHPMDYLTMSDNNCNWSSCMNWLHSGCYHVGTVEMMNSNVALCCYLESKTVNFTYEVFDDKKDTWNSKKWRQLFYINKDIILAGKPYPMVNSDLTKEILAAIKDLANKNMNWKYSYGPELYYDMLSVNSMRGMDRAREMLPMSASKNIFIDTNAMYNDLLNDNDTNYWCYRNKPKKSYILKVSGKAPCVACGKSVIGYKDIYGDYNDRYQSEKTVCEDCFSEIKCYECSNDEGMIGKKRIWNIIDKYGSRYKLCSDHIKTVISLCPCCKKPMRTSWHRKEIVFGTIREPQLRTFEEQNLSESYKIAEQSEIYQGNIMAERYHQGYFIPIFLCDDCLIQHGYTIEETNFQPHYLFFYGTCKYKTIKEPLIQSDEWIQKYCYSSSLKPMSEDVLSNLDTITLISEYER